MNDAFGVCPGIKAVAAFFQFRTKLRKVVDFAVIDNPGAAIFIENGLVTTGEIDDAEPPHAKASAVGDIDAFVVRPSMDDLIAHMAYQVFSDIAFPGCADDSGNSTHGRLLSFHANRRSAPFICCRRHTCNGLETVVAILARISVLAVAGRENNVCHFPRSHKM